MAKGPGYRENMIDLDSLLYCGDSFDSSGFANARLTLSYLMRLGKGRKKSSIHS